MSFRDDPKHFMFEISVFGEYLEGPLPFCMLWIRFWMLTCNQLLSAVLSQRHSSVEKPKEDVKRQQQGHDTLVSLLYGKGSSVFRVLSLTFGFLT